MERGALMKIHIESSGPLTTVQDSGRFGYMEYGITSSGVMDLMAYKIANRLVGNRHGEAVLEATLMGPSIRFEGDGQIAFYGADMQAVLDGEVLSRGKAYEVKDGQRITFSMAKNGVRLYIAFAGGINVPVVMGSRSTNIKCEIGGYEGRKLQAGDTLEIGAHRINNSKFMKKSVEPVLYTQTIKIRVILGPQDDYFTEKGIETFLGAKYKVSSESDRMGIRLLGNEIEGSTSMDIVSDGITFGSIQVTSKGLPIIMMADHQTTGGYAKIATVVSKDLSKLAQARPGDEIEFIAVSVEEVQKKRNWKTG